MRTVSATKNMRYKNGYALTKRPPIRLFYIVPENQDGGLLDIRRYVKMLQLPSIHQDHAT
jgi:hypothetical protein